MNLEYMQIALFEPLQNFSRFSIFFRCSTWIKNEKCNIIQYNTVKKKKVYTYIYIYIEKIEK